MAYKIGYVDNTGSEGVAHWQMLDTIRRFATGYGTAAAPVKTGTGTGTMGSVDTHPATVTETWTIACTSAATVGAEVWSVTGSVSGAQAAATTGVAYDNGLLAFLLTAGATAFAVSDQFTVATTLGALPAAARWTTLRYLNPVPYTDAAVTRELIMVGQGLSGTEQIFVGFGAYQNAALDYYNLSVAGFSGYVAGNAFAAQPGIIESGVPAHNNRIDYWLIVNAQRIALGMKVGTPVYEHAYVGKCLPYATPSQFPYPLFVGGMLTGRAATRFSETTHAFAYNGARANCRLRWLDGSWKQPQAWPKAVSYLGTQMRDTGGSYLLLPIVLYATSTDVYGELDGIYHISGFNNAVENTLVIDGVTYVVLQDVGRTGFPNYIAMRLN